MTIHIVRELDPPYDSNFLGADVHFTVPFMMERTIMMGEVLQRLRKAISSRLSLSELPIGNMDIHIDNPPNSEYQIAAITMRVMGEKAYRRWKFEYELQEAFNA